ncbi:MAG: hypothetical protein IJQ80_02225 [Clostridia bacterium]|nr:hypothetical protein [Clostridia bacterium]
MKMYCKNCSVVFEGDICPVCGSKRIQPPASDDQVFLAEKEAVWSEVLSDALDDNGIPFFTKGLYGAGMAIKIGPMFEKMRFFVLYKDLERASDIVSELFSAEGEVDPS